MNYPAASYGVSDTYRAASEEPELLRMQLNILFLSSLIGNIALDFAFTSIATDGADVVPIRPEFSTPEVFPNCRHPEENLASSDAFDRADDLCWAVSRDRLHKEMDMVTIGTDLDKGKFVPQGNLQADILQRPIHFGREHRSSILGRAYDMIQQDRNIMATMNLFTHAPEYSISARQAAGNVPLRIQSGS